ncbi:MAG: glucose-1-phosphate adenylyltransferase [Clostridiales bacterium]|nr:glucose-1-phosphate adenylyltransferase [Clostridiales bacterium]
MRPKECIAMLLAGGQGNRLGVLTKNLAKPAVPFGGKYRIIDFTLSNCANSGIDTVGVLTQYRPHKLNSYISTGRPWGFDRLNGGSFVLPPFVKGSIGEWYKGTADAIYQNIEFVEQYSPQFLLVLSGDHIYKMDYNAMLESHKANNADVTIAVKNVSLEDAGRYGIMNADKDGRIFEFQEKPKVPKSNKASMGIYIFNWKVLKEYLLEDGNDKTSEHDFGKNIIPKMLRCGQAAFMYPFEGYWKDVGTIRSLWEANMDLLKDPPMFNLYDHSWPIYCRNHGEPPHYMASCADAKNCIMTEGSILYGSVMNSVVSTGVFIDEGTRIVDSVIMPYVKVGKGAVIFNSIIAEKAYINDNCIIGHANKLRGSFPEITVIGANMQIPAGARVGADIDECVI